MELIERAELLKKAVKMYGFGENKYIPAKAVMEAPAVQPGWISVKDRLPDNLDPVNIVWVNKDPPSYYEDIKCKPFVATGYYHNGKWWWFSATCEDYLAEYGCSECDSVDSSIEITHWMPLPEPPKEVDHD